MTTGFSLHECDAISESLPAAILRLLVVWDDQGVTDVLADPVNAALDGPHIRFREVSGRIRRYRPDVSVFYGHPRELTDEDYCHVARLSGPRRIAVLRDRASPLPAAWSVVQTFGLVQY